MTTKELGRELQAANNCLGDGGMADLVNAMVYQHPTLRQSFAGKFVLPFVRELAMRHRAKNYDLRDQEACRLCDLMWTALEVDNPWLKDQGGFSGLPLI